MQELTDRQRQVYDFLKEYHATCGFPPSLREIAEHLSVSGTLGVMKHLAALERKGYIQRTSASSRGITLITDKRSSSIPVVGTVRAGGPAPAFEEIEQYLAIDREQLHGGTFLLRVKGDSMINAAIIEGDLALVRPQNSAENRDIVVALMEGEATLKRYYREPGRIRLQPENPNFSPIIIQQDTATVMIIGKVVGIFRNLA
jgi:repressor LexA